MSEQEWYNSRDPLAMLAFLEDKVSDRKFRLFACACCRRLEQYLTGEQSRMAIEVAERYADGLATDDELAKATKSLEIVPPVNQLYPNAPAYYATWDYALDAATSAAEASVEVIENAGIDPDTERSAQAANLRDLVGPLVFRPVNISSAWLLWENGMIPQLAEAIYEDQDFHRLPILADALEEAGCTEVVILKHLRSPGMHIRGCWVVDLILGKE